MSKRKIIIGILFSIVFLYLILWKPHFGAIFSGNSSVLVGLFGAPRIDFRHFWLILGEISIWPLVLCFLLTPLHVLVRAHRWTLIVRPLGRLKVYDSFGLQMVGYLANSILPLRMGEVVRGVLLANHIQTSRSSAVATVLLERVIDLLSMLLVILLVSLLYPFPKEVAEGATVFGIMAGIGVALIVYLAFGRDPFDGWIGRLLGHGKIGTMVKEQGGKFADGLIMLRHTRHHSVIAIESAVLWVIYAVQGYLVLMSFHFIHDYPLIAASPILASLVILVLNAVGVSLPSAPGNVGTFHAICIFGLSLFDVPPDAAAGYAVAIHAVTIIFYLLGGMPFMWREGLHLGQLRRLSPQEESDAAAKSVKENAS